MLHITNGNSVELNRTHIPGDVIFWADVLHEGPLDAGMTLEQLSETRAAYLAKFSDQSLERIREELGRRDRAIADFGWHSEVVLWFEHDLFDQLQLIQVLDWFSRRDRGRSTVFLIQANHYLGNMGEDELEHIFASRVPVTAAQFDLAARAWAAVCSSDPSAIVGLNEAGTAELPYLGPALIRLLRQYPSAANGLSRTESVILELAARGPSTPQTMFADYGPLDEPRFLGDSVFFWYLEQLRSCREPLLSPDLTLTDVGRQVAAGSSDHVERNGIDRWIGGVHLKGNRVAWRWDAAAQKLVRG
ncbi:MAG: DUF1835 domain-containing protein [Bryobacteraceae bacterium]|nr:DUF1835 domain-containing protein [Bryobacteraceae bacterium]